MEMKINNSLKLDIFFLFQLNDCETIRLVHDFDHLYFLGLWLNKMSMGITVSLR